MNRVVPQVMAVFPASCTSHTSSAAADNVFKEALSFYRLSCTLSTAVMVSLSPAHDVGHVGLLFVESGM